VEYWSADKSTTPTLHYSITPFFWNMSSFSPTEVARRMERVLARLDATRRDVEQLCAEARAERAHCVCVNGSYIQLACSLLEDSEVKVSGLVAYPLGAADTDAKRFETEVAIDHGAHEIEVVLNVGRLKDGDHHYVLRELRDIAEAADERPVKVILEMGLLTADEVHGACEAALDSGVHCVCTGTGLRSVATLQEVQTLRAVLGEKFGIKAAGVRDAQTALALLEAGATRLGTTANLTAPVPAQ
jgi:deoxyribose-phosphate aldolase